MKGGGGNFRSPKWGPLMPCVPPDSSNFSQDFHGGGHSFLSRANASPHQAPAWYAQVADGYDMHRGTPSPPGMSPRGHAQHLQQQRLRSVHNIQGYNNAQMPLGHLNGTGRRPSNPAPSYSPFNDMVNQEQGRRTIMMSPPESPSFPLSRGEGHGRTNVHFDTGLLPPGEDKIGLAERLATRIYSDLLTGQKGVSTEKVAQATLWALGVASFESLGVMPQDIPCLRKLALVESKVNAFVHSHVAGKKITTLYDLSLDLTRDEGVKEFEDLGLGPLLCHQLVNHYFSPPVGVEVHKITAGEVIKYLSDYVGYPGKDTRVQIESFLACVAKERSLPSPEHLCIRIQSLGMHIGFIRRSKKAEKELIGIWESRAKADFVKHTKPSVIERIDSFLAVERKSDASLGKRKFVRFSSGASSGSDDDIEDRGHGEGATKKTVGILQKSTRRSKVKLEDASSVTFPSAATTCPYPSAAEERIRLKKQELQQFVADSEQGDFHLTRPELQEFVTLLKDACENRSVHEVLMKMIEMSRKFKGTKKRSGKSKIFKAYPAIGLLNVAILSVKAGYWDSMYENFLDAADETGGPLKDQIRSFQVAAPIDVDSNLRQSTPCQAPDSPVPEEIVAAVSEHFEHYLKPQIGQGGRDTSQKQTKDWWLLLHWIYECEGWIVGKHSLTAFASLGYGSFSQFLEQYIDSLPSGIISILNQKNISGRHVAKVPRGRVLSFLAQALPMVPDSGSRLQHHISSLLCRQFTVSSVEELCANSLESLLQMSTDEKIRLAPCSHVYFLEPLVASYVMGGISEGSLLKGNCSETEASEGFHDMRVGVLGSMTSAEAAKCLLRAPFLADLSQWSQWHTVFAPTLGALLDWFETDGSKLGLHAIVTREGALLRVDGTATAESFLLATVQGCGDQMAAVLMSLIALYGGTTNTPTALLKSHTSKGLEILVGSTGGDWTSPSSLSPPVVSTKRKFTQRLGGQAMRLTRSYRGGKPKTSAEPTTSGTNIARTDSKREESVAGGIGCQISVAVRCVLECLSCVIPELRIFTAEILIPALSPLIAGTPAVLLSSCWTSQQKSILHGLGLSLGIPEWISDYKSHAFGSTQPSALCHISVPEDMEVDKSSQAELNKEVSEEVITQNVNCSMLNTVRGDCENACKETEMQNDQLTCTFESDRCRRSPQHRCTDGSNTVGQTSGKGHEEEASTDMPLGMASLEAQANMVIEQIRQYEFGVGQDIQGKECDLLARQHARMGRALHRLSSDLYSQDSHFVLELVQNADDNAYNLGVEAALVFLIQEGRIVVLNNETGFTAANIRALCDVGNSTKAGTSTGYIGHKGIGFKSVFRVTNAPEIHSNGFHVKFDISEGDLGFILPTCVPPCPPGDCNDDVGALMSGIEMPQSIVKCWNTRINLPIKASLRKGTGMSILASKFNDLHPSLLLFLHSLRCIAVRNDLTGSTVVMHREDCGEDLVKVVHQSGTATWMVVRRQLKAAVHRPGITDTEIALAFQLNQVSMGTYEACSEQQQVFAFLPLRSYGLRFIVQGDFKVPSSREEVDCDSDWNQWLRSEIPDVFVKSAKAFQKTMASGSPGKAMSSFLSFVPMEGEVLGFFSSLPRMILSTLRGSPCLPVEGGRWALPCVLLRGWSPSTRQLLPDLFLNEHLGLCYLDKDVMIPDILALQLGVQQFGAGTLVAVMKSVCHKKGALVGLGLKWVEAWLFALHDCFESDQQAYLPGLHDDRCSSFRLELQSLPYIPLSNGSFTSLSDGPVWFAGELLENGLGGSSVWNKFVLLSSDLRSVHPNLLSQQNESGISEEFAGATSSPLSVKHSKRRTFEKAVSILQRLGVSTLSGHEVLTTHVLPALAKDDCLLKDQRLVVEYLGFVMSHLESNCVACSAENLNLRAHLQKCAVILTSDGLIRAGQKPVHFTSAMGNNTLGMKQILKGTSVPWIEVSPLYLDLQAGGCELTKWRNFFKELGVTDFVEVLYTEKKLQDKSASVWKTCVWEEGVALDGSWILQDWHSPELVQILMDIRIGGPDSAVEVQKYSFSLRERCASTLVALDNLWDDYYYQFCQAKYSPLTEKIVGPWKTTVSSFCLLLQQCSWVISSLDDKLHVPTELFRYCDAVESILGRNAPYVVTQIQSEGFMKALGFRMQVLVDDALELLRYWSHTKGSFEASVAQMNRLYSFLWEKFPSHKEQVLSVFRSGASIFIPFHWSADNEAVQKGWFYPLGSVCWSDPTNILDMNTFDQETRLHLPITPLCSLYNGLYDFFVGECLVEAKPSFDGYLEILRKLASEQPPCAVLRQVMEVFNLWSLEISTGNVEPSEILRWKRRLEEVESSIFATSQGKWVSLNDRTGIVCVCDDEKLGREFEESLGCIHFLLMRDDDLTKVCERSSYQKTNKWTLQPLVQALCIPKLSEVVEREVIKYGQHDSGKIEALVDWVLPYAQRYMNHHHVDQYKCLQGIGITKVLRGLQFAVVDQLYFQYTLKNSVVRSNKRRSCTCILEDNTLHVVEDFERDHCNIYAELSRLLFSGKPNLSVANFLHLITLMASSGSPENEVEGFIQNVQGIQPMMKGEDLWTLHMGISDSHLGNSSESKERSSGYYLERQINKQNLRKKGRRDTVMVGWPPNSWKPLVNSEGVSGSSEKIGHARSKEGVMNPSEGRLQVDHRSGYSSTVSALGSSPIQIDSMLEYKNLGHIQDSLAFKDKKFYDGAPRSIAVEWGDKCMFSGDFGDVPSQHRPSYAVFEEEKNSTKASHYQEQENLFQGAGSAKETRSPAGDVQEIVTDYSNSVLVENMPEAGATTNFQAREFLVTHPVNEQQRGLTGRAGEALVFQYLSSHYGPTQVKWLNQESESGAAYDIVVIRDSGKQEYVEVKSTRSGGKDWFEISPREWDFAKLHSDSFTIMRVFLGPTTQQVRLLRLPNPVKLVQEHVLQLALLVPAAKVEFAPESQKLC